MLLYCIQSEGLVVIHPYPCIANSFDTIKTLKNVICTFAVSFVQELYKVYWALQGGYSTVASLGSLCTGCMLIIQYCYTGGSTKHKINGTVVFSDCIML